ncbi:DUF995 domain-containing protein [Labrys wisconsinensis]|uniref:DUF995 domain-containing protein n=1 Tax=Labrys wisconsinensis TaxID=425677 RepID=A0ABU0J5H4_9HYPH|nr:DUF995 domain-containing protein [Labrys wisconsinensis]MDQ0469509.1 hypothetical protein [Labrys wisconsinensis]
MRAVLFACAASLLVTQALGAGLPKRAKPFSAADVTAIYAGNTIEWGHGAGFLAADGKLTAYWTKPGEEGYAAGTWTVSGNEFCYSASWVNAAKRFDESFCWKLYHVGKKTFYQETRATDGRTLTVTAQGPRIVAGDKATTQAEAMKAKIGQ